WSGLFGLGAGAFWSLSGTGPYRWLADWQKATGGAQAPFLVGGLVILLTLLASLSLGYCLFTYLFGSTRYELALPCTVQAIPEGETALVRFADIEVLEPDHGKTIVRVPGDPFLSLIDETNLATRNWKGVVVDLSKVDYLSAKVLGKLLSAQ